MKRRICLTGILLLFATIIFSQQIDSTIDKISQFPAKLFGSIHHKTEQLDHELTRQTEKYLEKLARKEKKFQKKLAETDSASAARLFAKDPQQGYIALIEKLKHDSAAIVNSMGGEYLPYVDSLQGTLAFLNKNPQLLNTSKILPADIQKSLGQLQQLETKLQDADQVKQFIVARKAELQQYIMQLAHVPPGLSSIYNDYNKQLYYYSEQIREYRQILNDPDKMERLALQLLNKVPAFNSFMKSNSFLAGLFNIPDNYGTSEGLVGLQTRDQVMSIIQGQIGSGGPNASAMLQNSLQTAQQDINQIRNKLSALGGGNADIDMPKFKPNEQKTKTFWKRLEYGTNLQTEHADYFFPTTTDLGFSVGYKITDKNTIGIGASYKIGWGSDISHVNVTSEGVGLRSFLDMQLKKSFYVSGGYEMNYQEPFNSWMQLNNMSSWQQSGLVGLTKMVSINTKFLKKTKIQLLWDFLSYYNIPRTNPVKFRVGYNF